MTYEVVCRTRYRVPRKFLEFCASAIPRQLRAKVKGAGRLKKHLIIVFVSSSEMKKLNGTFRGKSYATDVLSFEGIEEDSLGDLVFCPQVIARQAREHHLPQELELGYLLIHGILHLLGYDHEKSESEAKKMFRIQDQVFDRLCRQRKVAKKVWFPLTRIRS